MLFLTLFLLPRMTHTFSPQLANFIHFLSSTLEVFSSCCVGGKGSPVEHKRTCLCSLLVSSLTYPFWFPPAAPAAAWPENLSEMQILRAHPKPTESESEFQQDFHVICMHVKVEKHWARKWELNVGNFSTVWSDFKDLWKRAFKLIYPADLDFHQWVKL